jgi:hypothetical protein
MEMATIRCKGWIAAISTPAVLNGDWGGNQIMVMQDVQKKNSTHERDRDLIVPGENGKLALSSLDF